MSRRSPGPKVGSQPGLVALIFKWPVFMLPSALVCRSSFLNQAQQEKFVVEWFMCVCVAALTNLTNGVPHTIHRICPSRLMTRNIFPPGGDIAHPDFLGLHMRKRAVLKAVQLSNKVVRLADSIQG